jgi:hypothetical protein
MKGWLRTATVPDDVEVPGGIFALEVTVTLFWSGKCYTRGFIQ